MNRRWLVLMVFSLTLAACGMIDVQGQILDPTQIVTTDITTTQMPTEPELAVIDDVESQIVEEHLPNQQSKPQRIQYPLWHT